MLTHKKRDFTFAHFKFNSTNSRATQANANRTFKQLHLLLRNWITLSQTQVRYSKLVFSCIWLRSAVWGRTHRKFWCPTGLFHNSTPISSPKLSQK